jgi:hypothetical protein
MINNNKIPIEIMIHNQLSQLEKGCNGRMTLENGKIVFDFESNGSVIPQPNAPPLIIDDPIVDELRNELRETKQRLAFLEQQVQQLFKFRETVYYATDNSPTYIHNLNETKIRLLAPRYEIFLGDKMQINERFGGGDLSINLKIISVQLCNLQTITIDFTYYNSNDITSNCAIIIKFIVEKIKTIHRCIEIVINSRNGASRVNFIIALCEQLNHEKLSKLKITHAKISEQTELKNKIDKQIFKKIEIENLITSI